MLHSTRIKGRSYIFNIKDGDRGADTEAFIKAALDHDQIQKWAYCLHDKDVYNQHDLDGRLLGASYNWASGFQGMEQFSSKQEYLEDQMRKPPFAGDKKEARWYIFIIADKSVYDEDIADWFEMPNVHYLRDLTGSKLSIKDAIMSLTNEDRTSVIMERYHYPDNEVRANFNFREYMEGIRINRYVEQLKDSLRPAPLRIRRRPEK